MLDLDNLDPGPLRHVARCAVVGASTKQATQIAPTGTATADTSYRIASLTKPLSAVAAALAARCVGVDLDTYVLDVLPDLRGDWAAEPRVTVAQVLSQTSGLASTVTADDILRLGHDDAALFKAARLVVRAGSVRPPGQRWEYYNGNYFLAGAILEALTGRAYEVALNDLVLRPWGLTSTSFALPAGLAPGVDGGQPITVAAYPRGRRPSGGLYSTAGDLLAFGECLLDDADLLAQVRTVRTRPEDPMRYGLGWALGPSGQMYLNGRLPGYRSAMMVVPDHGLVAVTLAADVRALPTQARILSDLQRDLTGDDLAEQIDAFAR